jgi:uncharacterized protein YggU (UPF0235/DUF167 family)
MSVGRGVLQRSGKGVVLRVRLTPRSQRDEITGLGLAGGKACIAARVRAVPEENQANRALEQLVADWLGVARSSVSLAAGGRSRVKSVAVAGDEEALKRLVGGRLAALDTKEV